mgnify:CR=1 FL=1
MNSCDEMLLCVNQTDESTLTSTTSTFLSSENTTSNETLWMNIFELIKQRPLAPEEKAKNIVIITCYSLIVIISLIGNLVVMKVILFGKKKMLTTTNVLIASLAFSDIVMTALNIPFNVARLLLDHWPFGQVLCVLVPFIQVSCVYVSTFTMAIIAYHRWKILSQPVINSAMKKNSNRKLILIILLTWFFAGLLSIPHSAFNREVIRYNVLRCRVVYPELGFEFDWHIWLTIEALLTQYLIPLSITCYLYIKIGLIVSNQSKLAMRLQNHLNHYCNGKKSKQNHFEQKRRRIIMLILVVVIFAVCWFPLNLYHLLNDFKLIRSNFRLFLICHWFAMSSVCYNPFIYCWLNESFKKGARKFLNTFFKCILIDKITKQRTDSLSDNKHLNAVNIEVDIQNEEQKSSETKQIYENPIYNHMEFCSKLIIHQQQNELTSTTEINGDQSLNNLSPNKAITANKTLIVQIEMSKFDCDSN